MKDEMKQAYSLIPEENVKNNFDKGNERLKEQKTAKKTRRKLDFGNRRTYLPFEPAYRVYCVMWVFSIRNICL